MAQDESNKEDQFDFSREGEAAGYISLAQARVVAVQTARASPARRRWIRTIRMVFEFLREQEDEDFYTIVLSFRPEGNFVGAPGQEQFIISKTGVIEYRGVLSHPKRNGTWAVKRLATAIVVIGGGIAAAVIVPGVMDGDDSENAPVPLSQPAIASPPSSITEAPVVENEEEAAKVETVVAHADAPAVEEEEPVAEEPVAEVEDPSAAVEAEPVVEVEVEDEAPAAVEEPAEVDAPVAEITGVSFIGAGGYTLSLYVESIPEAGPQVYLVVKTTTLSGLTTEANTQFIRLTSGGYSGKVIVGREFIEDADLDWVRENVIAEILLESR